MTREQIQEQALNCLIENNGKGTLVIDTGVGKSKIAIDYLNHLQRTKTNDVDRIQVLITVPRTNLINNWLEQINRWLELVTNLFQQETLRQIVSQNTESIVVETQNFYITIETVQTSYKWIKQEVKFDVIIADEIHTYMTPEYSAVFALSGKHLVGLTATPDIKGRDKADKLALYQKYCPIIYEYLEGEKDGVVNKVKLIVIEHTLDNLFKYQITTKKFNFSLGELEQYEYICKQLLKGQRLMIVEGSSNFFTDAANWYWKREGATSQKNAARVYLNAITARKNFLLSLSSTREITAVLAKKILAEHSENKILIFSELTAQIDKICINTVHSNNKPEVNESNLARFNKGEIRTLGSCYSLTLGLNMKAANHAIFESYLGSETKQKQRKGRLHRLGVDETAKLYMIRVVGTQADSWFDNMTSEDCELSDIISSKTILNT